MRRLLPPLLLSCLALIGGCSSQEGAAPARPAANTAHLVETAQIIEGPLAQSATRTGTLRAERTVRILPQEEGRIIALPFFAGDRVRQGEQLLRLDDSLLSAELRKAQAQRRQAELDLQRLERLLERHLVSDDEAARARTALDIARADEQLLRTRLDNTVVHAPFAGVISQRLAEPGDVVPRFTHVLTLTDPSSLVTDVTVSELLLPSLALGDPVEMVVDALGSAAHAGRITRIYPTVDPLTRLGTVEITLSPAPRGTLPGQLCRVTLTGRAELRRTIPFAALRRDNRGEFVFTVDATGNARRSAVVSGEQLGEYIELIDGPSAGQAVIIKGFLGLADGTPVKVAAASVSTPQ